MKASNNNAKRRSKKENSDEIDLKTQTIDQLYQMAELEYKRLSQNQHDKWHQIISKSGTKKDKVGLMATSILKNPHTSLEQFGELTKWCFDKNHHFALDACRALVNIYNQYVFNGKTTLKMFYDSVQELIKNHKKKCVVGLADLVGMYLEHHIKHYYSQFLRSIQDLLGSTISFVKKSAISLLTILTRHGELRRLIINILINKFGDSDMEIVNQTFKTLKSQFYQDLESSYILLEESQTFLFRENVSRKSQFYVINFLNNLNMKFLAQKGLSKLFELFYHFFQKLMGDDSKQGSVSSRLFLNSIKGLNKIFTFIKGGNKQTKELISSKIESVYKIVHTTQNIKAKIQLYLFLFQYHSHIHGSLTDRYYRSLYEFIGKPDILHCSLAQLFFDLILISIKQDQNINRMLAFIKRMLQLCLTAQANFIATTLIMIGKVIEEKESLRIVLHQKENAMAEEGQQFKGYDANKREPIYAGAQSTLVWELTIFANHYHPTVRKFATHIVKGQDIPYSGTNPMLELSTTSFLEKLILKKQKKSQSWKLKMKKHLNHIRKSKYETLMDKDLQNFNEDQEFIKKYLQQRSAIHTNFKKKQPTDIQDFADQVIQKEMDRLNPKYYDDDFSMSIQGEDQEDQMQSEGEEDQEGEEGEEGQAEEDFEDNQFGSEGEEVDEGQEFGFDQGEGEDEDDFGEDQMEDEDNDEEQSGVEKQFEEVFNQIGNDKDDYPRKEGRNSRFNGKANKSRQIIKGKPKGKQNGKNNKRR